MLIFTFKQVAVMSFSYSCRLHPLILLRPTTNISWLSLREASSPSLPLKTWPAWQPRSCSNASSPLVHSPFLGHPRRMRMQPRPPSSCAPKRGFGKWWSCFDPPIRLWPPRSAPHALWSLWWIWVMWHFCIFLTLLCQICIRYWNKTVLWELCALYQIEHVRVRRSCLKNYRSAICLLLRSIPI